VGHRPRTAPVAPDRPPLRAGAGGRLAQPAGHHLERSGLHRRASGASVSPQALYQRVGEPAARCLQQVLGAGGASPAQL